MTNLDSPAVPDMSSSPGWWQASDGQWYPPQAGQAPPGPPAKKKRHTFRWVALAAVVLLVVVIVAAGSGSKKTTSTPPAFQSPSSNPSPAPAPAAAHKVGDTATTSGWQVTVYAAQDPYVSPGGIITPLAGDRFVRVDVQIRNTKSDAQPFSSLLAFKIMDSTNRAYSQDIMSEGAGPPDGQIPGGQAIRGYVTFAVPTTATGLIFQVQGSLTAAGARFQL